MKKVFITFATLLIATGLAGASCSKADMGMTAGGVVGGAAGAALTDGSPVGAVVGAVGGAYVGRKLAE